MAENQDDQPREDLSDEPSPHRIEELRKKGQVAQSKELSSLVGLMATASALYFISPFLATQMGEFVTNVFKLEWMFKPNFTFLDYLISKVSQGMRILAFVGLPVALAGFILGAAGSFLQIGSIFSTDPLNPDLNKINPVKGLKKFLSLRQLYDGVRLVFKGFVVAAVAYFLVKAEIIEAPLFLVSDPAILPGQILEASRIIFVALCSVLLAFAGLDLWIQRWEYSKNTRLTKKEAKQEHKEREGDPLIKSRIRTVQREMSKRRMMEAVKTADVVVTNPTHIAVALKYASGEMSAPKVVAKGADFLAQKIKKIASQSQVPMIENVPLARTLYRTVKVGQFVPRVLYQAVAEVLAYVYRFKNKKGST